MKIILKYLCSTTSYFFIWRDFKKKEKKNDNNNLLVLPNKIQHGVNDEEEEKKDWVCTLILSQILKDYDKIFISIPPDEKLRDCYKNIFKNLILTLL